MRPHVSYHCSLRELAASIGVDKRSFDHAKAALLGDPANDRLVPCRVASRPRLNADGTALQLAVSHRAAGLARRLLCDPSYGFSSDGGLGSARLVAIRRVFTMWHAQSLIPLIESASGAFGSIDVSVPAANPDSVVGISLDGPGAAIYFRIDQTVKDVAWAVLTTWFEELFPVGAQVHGVVRDLVGEAYFVGLGIEGVDTQRGRIKIYWQLRKPLPLAEIKAPFVGDPAIAQFLNDAIGETAIGLHSLFFSTAFSLSSGDVFDGKVDVCGHCVHRSLIAWKKIIDQTATTHGLTHSSFASCENPRYRQKEGISVEFVGLGIDRDHNHRLNVYFSEQAA